MFRRDCNFLCDAARSGTIGYLEDAFNFFNSSSFNIFDYPRMKSPWLHTDTEISPMMEACYVGNLECIQFLC